MMVDFTRQEIEIIKKEYPSKGIEIAGLLPKHSRTAIQDKAKRMGIRVLCLPYECNIKRDDAVALAMAIDCEGTIGLWKRSGRLLCYNPQIAIYNTNYKLIEWIRSVITPLPFRLHVDDRGSELHKIAYNLAVRGIGATYSLLDKTLPFFKMKGELAELLYEFDSNKIRRPIRQQYSARDHEIYNKLRELNKKGPPVQ